MRRSYQTVFRVDTSLNRLLLFGANSCTTFPGTHINTCDQKITTGVQTNENCTCKIENGRREIEEELYSSSSILYLTCTVFIGLHPSCNFLIACIYVSAGKSSTRVRAKQQESIPVSYTHLRAHETVLDLVCRLLLEKKKKKKI